ncbi:MAG: hypothetical protein ACR2JW_01735 [Thermomicrobiales bacterium]
MAQTIEAEAPAISFAGNAAQQALAREMLLVMQSQGRFFATGLPIRQPLAALVDYATARKLAPKDAAKAVEAAVRANPLIFALEGEGADLTVVTTRDGLAPGVTLEGMSHSFAHRLTEPAAAPPPEPKARAERPLINTNWYNEIVVPADAEDEDEDEQDTMPSAITELFAAHQEAVAEPPLDSAVAPAEAEAETAAELEEVITAAADPSTPAGALEQALASDLRFIAFGPEYFLRDMLESYGRNDTRRISDYIKERGEPLSDVDLLLDVYGKRRTDTDFQTTCFSLNTHLATEKDFEFVGTAERRLWSVEGLPTIGSEKRKAADIGQDYRVLLEYPTATEEQFGEAEEYVEHILTQYEYEYGVLPLDGDLARFFPGSYVSGQRAAVVTFEAPQHYLTFNVEIRYPTGNRGGFLSGFSTFFHENLVPGALFTIERGDTAGTYRIQYLQVSAQERRLLQVDEKKGRFTFKPVTFYCTALDQMLLSENRLPRLAQAKPLDARDRRVLAKVVAAAFERGGENVGEASAPRYLAEFDDLFVLTNIERPTPPEALRAILTSGANGFSEEDGLYYYSPTQ